MLYKSDDGKSLYILSSLLFTPLLADIPQGISYISFNTYPKENLFYMKS